MSADVGRGLESRLLPARWEGRRNSYLYPLCTRPCQPAGPAICACVPGVAVSMVLAHAQCHTRPCHGQVTCWCNRWLVSDNPTESLIPSSVWHACDVHCQSSAGRLCNWSLAPYRRHANTAVPVKPLPLPPLTVGHWSLSCCNGQCLLLGWQHCRTITTSSSSSSKRHWYRNSQGWYRAEIVVMVTTLEIEALHTQH